MQSSKDCSVTKFYCFSTSEKYRIIFHFIMNLHFLQLSFQDVPKLIESSCRFIFLTLIVKTMGVAYLQCSLYTIVYGINLANTTAITAGV